MKLPPHLSHLQEIVGHLDKGGMRATIRELEKLVRELRAFIASQKPSKTRKPKINLGKSRFKIRFDQN
jgi:hypothetical protein